MPIQGRLKREDPLLRIHVDCVSEPRVLNRTDQPPIDHSRLAANDTLRHELRQRRSSRSCSRSRRLAQRSVSRRHGRRLGGAIAPSQLGVSTYLRQWQRRRRRTRSRRRSRGRSVASEWDDEEDESQRTFDGLSLLKELTELLRGGAGQQRGRSGGQWDVPEPAPLVEVSDRLFVSKLAPDLVHKTLCPPAPSIPPPAATTLHPCMHPSTASGDSTANRDRAISDDVMSPSSSTNKLAAVQDFTRYPYAPHNPSVSPWRTRRSNLLVPTISGEPRRPPILFHSVDDVLKRGDILFLPPAARSFPSVRKFILNMDTAAQAQLAAQNSPLTHYRLQHGNNVQETQQLELLETGHTNLGPPLPPPPVYEYPHEEAPVNHLVLIWRQACSYRVEVAGTFTNPPWTHLLTLYWCPRQQFHWIDVNEAIGFDQRGHRSSLIIEDDRPITTRASSDLPGAFDACSPPSPIGPDVFSGVSDWPSPSMQTPRAAAGSSINEGYSTFSRRTPSPSHLSEHLLAGPYRFKFIVDGEWKCDPTLAVCEDHENNVNNIVVVCAQLRRRASQRRLRQRHHVSYQRLQQHPEPAVDILSGQLAAAVEGGLPGVTPPKNYRSEFWEGEEQRLSTAADSLVDGRETRRHTDEANELVRSNSLRHPSPRTMAGHKRPVFSQRASVDEVTSAHRASGEATRVGGYVTAASLDGHRAGGSVGWRLREERQSDGAASPASYGANEAVSPSSAVATPNLNRCQSAYSNCRDQPPTHEGLRRMSSMCIDYWPLAVVEHLHNADVLLDLKELPDVRQNGDLEMQCAAVMIPHPDKVESGGADAYFLASDGRAVGVADGVGEWDTFGLNPRMFAEEVMQGCKRVADGIGDYRRYAESVRKRREYKQALIAAGQQWRRSHMGGAGGGELSAGAGGGSAGEEPNTSSELESNSEAEECPLATSSRSVPLCDPAASYDPSPSISPAHKRANPILYPAPPLHPRPKSFHRRHLADTRIEDRAMQLLAEGFRNAKSFGSCTGLVACLDDEGGRLGVANLGDSALIVLRRQKVFTMSCVHRTREQQHQFNCPFQLSRLPDPSQFGQLLAEGKERLVRVLQNNAMMPQDTPDMATAMSLRVQEGDLVLVGTDGLFDNLFDYEICQLANLALSPYDSIVLHDKSLVTSAYSVAKALGEAASYRSRDPRARTPFMRHARQSGANYLGGKLDDITVVACWVVRKSHKEDGEDVEEGEEETVEEERRDDSTLLRRGASVCL
eukprot:GHVS01006873.1.p1 GENE.GHVS01006873.1~~GHVS01006873.1.p1  ORF type:complete len:1245 (-),score=216.88 GHVS01006873.1:100-3834(-)